MALVLDSKIDEFCYSKGNVEVQRFFNAHRASVSQIPNCVAIPNLWICVFSFQLLGSLAITDFLPLMCEIFGAQ